MASIAKFDEWQNSAGTKYGTVLKVVQVVKTDTFTTTTNAYQDVTGLSISFTPSSASNKILVIPDIAISNDTGNLSSFRLLRGSTVIYGGDANGNRTQGFVGRINSDTRGLARATAMFLDSPNTTSSVTYKIQCNTEPGGYIVAVNRNVLNDLNDYRGVLAASSITLMEIQA
jgi:hypothetical protein